MSGGLERAAWEDRENKRHDKKEDKPEVPARVVVPDAYTINKILLCLEWLMDKME